MSVKQLSARGVYTALASLSTLSFLILISNAMGYLNNTAYGRISESVANDAGIQPFMTGGNARSEYMGYVIKDYAGSFIHLTNGAATTVTWVLLLSLIAMAFVGVVHKSPAMTLLPGLAYIIVSTMIGGDYISRDSSVFTQNMVLSVALVTAAATFVVVAFTTYFGPRQDIPTHGPASRESESVGSSRD